jgi:hypothetical protein
MKKSTLISLLATGLTFSTLNSAQTEAAAPAPASTPAAQMTRYASPVAAPGYLGLTYTQGELHATFSDSRSDHLSPKFLTVGLEQGQSGAGFRAVHPSSSLTEIVNYYWQELAGLGFEGVVTAASRDVTTYAFADGDRDLRAVFTRQGSSVVAELSWEHAELVASN